MAEEIKKRFTWDDREECFSPCDYCAAMSAFPPCDDGATSSACNHCDYNALIYLLTHHSWG